MCSMLSVPVGSVAVEHVAGYAVKANYAHVVIIIIDASICEKLSTNYLQVEILSISSLMSQLNTSKNVIVQSTLNSDV